MMIKCQKCGFENQMGSIFCRECGEKLNMNAIDPNKLQKDVDKEKRIKATKKKIKSLVSTGIGVIFVVAFIFVVFPEIFPFYKGRQYEEPSVAEASVNQKFNAVVSGNTVGKAKYTYPEINQMLKTQVVEPLSEIDSFAKVKALELAFDEEKGQPVAYVWISLKDKVPVLYTIHGRFFYNAPNPDNNDDVQEEPISIDVKRLDIGLLPLFVSTHTFLDGFKTLQTHQSIQAFFGRAEDVEFTAEGMNVTFKKGGPTGSLVPAAPSTSKPSASAGVAALKGGSAAAVSEKNEAAKQKAEAARQKAEEEKEKKKQLEEERKRKAEEYRQQQKEKEEERKRKLEEEKERKKQEEEERKRKIEEEAQRRREEAEERRREREERRYNNNNNYNNGRNSRSSRSSRNRY